MEPWYHTVTPRKEVREGQSFNPDEFAIHLEQVIGKTAPEDYRNPEQFFARTCFTQALRSHLGLVLRRLAGETVNAPPVLTLVTSFGGGKTHTLTALYHLAASGRKAALVPEVKELLAEAGLSTVPEARVAAFVGNAWDPREGRETPWIDIARQLAGAAGVEALGTAARTVAPGTEVLGTLFRMVNRPILLLFDEVLNFFNRHRELAEPMYAFIQNLSSAMTGMTGGAAVISLPQSRVEMTDWDITWQGRITKVVHRVSKDLMANDEEEIAEVIRRRLFEDLGKPEVRRGVSKVYAEWCLKNRDHLPPEWTSMDAAAGEESTRGHLQKYLQNRFEACYPFHPAVLSVFQRKWQALPQYQQTRGTLAMLAQWVSWAFDKYHKKALPESLITLGSAPLENRNFLSIVLGQLGVEGLGTAIEADICGNHAHALALDADTHGELKDIHRRVGTAILFESSGAQKNQSASLPELRFALCGPGLDTTSVDNAAHLLESRSFFIRKTASGGYRIGNQATLKKVLSDCLASLDEEKEILPRERKEVEDQFRKGAAVPVIAFPEDGAAIPDTPKLSLVLGDPSLEWTGEGPLREKIAAWTFHRGGSPRLYPGSLVWCLKQPGRNLREKVEQVLAWDRVEKMQTTGALGDEISPEDKGDIGYRWKMAKEEVKDGVWGGYRFAILAAAGQDRGLNEGDGLKVIDLGAGHSSGTASLCGRIMEALKTQGILNETIGASFLDRHWPPAFRESGAWPLTSLRQSFLNGALTRLLDPDHALRMKICEFVKRGDFGLASGNSLEGSYSRVWFEEAVSPEEAVFESGVFLLTRETAQALKRPAPPSGASPPRDDPGLGKPPIPPAHQPTPADPVSPAPPEGPRTGTQLHLSGKIPLDSWNRLGTRLIPLLRGGAPRITLDVSVEFGGAPIPRSQIEQVLEDLELAGEVQVRVG